MATNVASDKNVVGEASFAGQLVQRAPAPTLVEDVKLKSISPNELVWRRFRRHRAAVAGAFGLALIVALIIVGSFLTPIERANRPDVTNILAPPTPLSQILGGSTKSTHLFGTDATGRDVFARVLYGGQISLAVGILAVVLSLFVGVLIGGLAGYLGGTVDAVLMRFTEAVLAIPALFLLIVIGRLLGSKMPSVPIFGQSISGTVIVVIVVIGLTSWMYEARIVRANILSLRERDFVAAAQALGVSKARILFRHLVPNTLAPIIVAATLGLATAIGLEAYASFLGLGVQDPPTASWGNMITQAINYMQSSPPKWWLWFFPGLFITLTVLCINFIGDGLRDAFDPRQSV